MSDGTWDVEYDRADSLKEEVKRYCEYSDLECPIFENHMMIREVESVFADIKLNNIKKCNTCRYNNRDLKLPCGYCEEYNQWNVE